MFPSMLVRRKISVAVSFTALDRFSSVFFSLYRRKRFHGAFPLLVTLISCRYVGGDFFQEGGMTGNKRASASLLWKLVLKYFYGKLKMYTPSSHSIYQVQLFWGDIFYLLKDTMILSLITLSFEYLLASHSRNVKGKKQKITG